MLEDSATPIIVAIKPSIGAVVHARIPIKSIIGAITIIIAAAVVVNVTIIFLTLLSKPVNHFTRPIILSTTTL